MTRYMLDTDMCSYVMKRSHPGLLLLWLRMGDPVPDPGSSCQDTGIPHPDVRPSLDAPAKYRRACAYEAFIPVSVAEPRSVHVSGTSGEPLMPIVPLE